MCSKTELLISKKCIGGSAWCGCMRGACQLQIVRASVQLNSVVNSRYSNSGPPEYLSAKTTGPLELSNIRKIIAGRKMALFLSECRVRINDNVAAEKNRSWPVSTQMLQEQDYGIQQTRQSASVCRIEHTNFWMWRLYNANSRGVCVTAGSRVDVAENCAIPGYYAASSGNFLPTFRSVVNKLPILAA